MSKRKDECDKYSDWRFGMIVSTMINLFVGKKSKLDAFEVMGHGKKGLGGGSTEKVQSPAETALRFRLLQAANKRSGGVKHGG